MFQIQGIHLVKGLVAKELLLKTAIIHHSMCDSFHTIRSELKCFTKLA